MIFSTLDVKSRYLQVEISGKIDSKLLYVSSGDLLLQLHALQHNGAWDISTSNGRPIDEIHGPICLCLFRGYCYILVHARRTHLSCSRSIDLISRRWCYPYLEKFELFMNCIDHLVDVIHTAGLVVFTRATDSSMCRLEYHTTVPKLRSILKLCNVFRRVVPSFACVASPLNEKPCKGQSQTFHGLHDDGFTTLQPLK